jgi:hypothetical protein
MKKQHHNYRHFRLMLVILLSALLLALRCGSTGLLKDVQENYAQQQYDAILQLTDKIDACDKQSDQCGQLHLYLGSAHAELAKMGRDEEANYKAAVAHIEQGISLIENWRNVDREQFYRNLCAAYLKVHDTQAGAEAENTRNKLLKTAQEYDGFAASDAHKAAAKFFVVKAELMITQVRINRLALQGDISAADRQSCCSDLNRHASAASAALAMPAQEFTDQLNQVKQQSESLKNHTKLRCGEL